MYIYIYIYIYSVKRTWQAKRYILIILWSSVNQKVIFHSMRFYVGEVNIWQYIPQYNLTF